MNKCLLLKVTIALFAIPSLAVAQGVCETVNRILDSGINNRFAAVAGLYLPNASECRLVNNSVYQCIWGDLAAIDRYRELSREFRQQQREIRRESLELSLELSLDDYVRWSDEQDEAIQEIQRTVDAVRESFSSEARRESSNFYQAMYGCFQTGAIADATAYNLINDSDDGDNDWTWSKPAGCSVRISSGLDTRLRFSCPLSTQ